MLAYLLPGLALGAGSSLIPSPCGLAVINAAMRRDLARALAIGFGAALGDFVLATLGIHGLGPLLARHPSVPPVLHAFGGVGLIGDGPHDLWVRRAEVCGDAAAAPVGHPLRRGRRRARPAGDRQSGVGCDLARRRRSVSRRRVGARRLVRGRRHRRRLVRRLRGDRRGHHP